MSPGTSSAAGIAAGTPSRTTVAAAAAIFLSAAMAFSARYSWMKPSTALSTTITTMAMVSAASPSTPATTAAAISTRIMKSLNWSRNIASSVRLPFSTSSFGPCAASRAAASAALEPLRRASRAPRRPRRGRGRARRRPAASSTLRCRSCAPLAPCNGVSPRK